jgi:HK97 gp10 family phage protein
MVDRLTIKIQGADLIRANLEAMRKEVKTKHVKAAANKGARIAKEAIQLEAEKKFWRGRRKGGLTNVRVRVDKKLQVPGINEAREVYMKWPEAAHWHLLEFGTGERVTKKPRRYVPELDVMVPAKDNSKMKSGLPTTVQSTGRGPQRAFIRPAYEKNKQRIAAAIADELAKPAKKKRRTVTP